MVQWQALAGEVRMGLCKKLHTKICEGRPLSVAEKRFGGVEPYPSPKKKRGGPKSNDEFIADILKDLL